MKVAAVQMTASDSVERNLNAAEALIDEAVSKGAQVVALPETWTCIGKDDKLIRDSAEPLNGPIVQRMQAAARRHNIYLHCGSLNERPVSGLEPPRGEKRRLLSHFLAQERDEVEAGRSACAFPPFRKLGVGSTAFGTEGKQGCQQQSAVGSHRQNRLLGYRGRVP